MSNDLLDRESEAVDGDWDVSDFGGELESLAKHAPDHTKDDSDNKLVKADSSPSSEPQHQGFVFKMGQRLGKKRGKKLSKWRLIVSGGIAISAGMAIVFILIFLSTLIIPHFMNNVIGWQFASTTREFRQANEKVLAEKTELDTASDAEYTSLRQQITDQAKSIKDSIREKTIGKFDNLRPQKIFENMEAEGRIQYNYSEPSKFLRRQKLLSVTVDGEEIPVDFKTGKLSNFFSDTNRSGQLQFAGELKANIDDSLGDYNSLIRDAVFKKMLDKLGIKLHFWNRFGEEYQGAKQAQADELATKQLEEKIDEPPAKGASSTINSAIDKAEKVKQDCLANPDCVDKMNADPTYLDNLIAQSAESAVSESALQKVLSGLSTSYAIALPVCIIYDGSVEHSGSAVNHNDDQLEKTFISYASIGNQQEAKGANGTALAALARPLGNVGNSIPQRRLSPNDTPDQTAVQSPQASSSGTYTLLNALPFLPKGAAAAINSAGEPACKLLTDLRVAGAAAVAELVAAFLSDGGSKATEEGIATSIRIFVTDYVKELATKDFAKRFAIQTAAIGATTLLAKWVVLNEMAQGTSGTSRGQNLTTNIDMGGKLVAGDLNRQQQRGRPLDASEAVQNNADNIAFLDQQDAKMSITQRYFALSNSRSLLSMAGMSLANTSWQNTIVKGFASLASVFTLRPFTQLLANLFQSTPARAAEAQLNDYPIVTWAWSRDEMQAIDNNPTYSSPLTNAAVLDKSGKAKEIADKYGKCFTEPVGTLLEKGDIIRDSKGIAEAAGGDCSPTELGMNNPTYGDLVFRWRLADRYNNSIDHLTEIANAN